ncbi:MAG: YraN family protein [Gammaproteobacteria bacterium]|nr:YraN family protein [Gammaproteobacteria bacterium]
MSSTAGRRSAVGREAEHAACEFLRQQGLQLLQRNFRVAGGEIDLVMSDGAIIVFVEVRARSDADFMHPAESINARKRRRLIHAGTRYLQDAGNLHSARARFDVICITGAPGTGRIEWIRNAFSA